MILPELLHDSRWLRQALQIGSGVIVVAVLGFGGLAWYRSQESRGLGAIAEASALAQQASGPQASREAREDAIKALESAIAQYPRVAAVQQAAYELGNLKYSLGQYGAARSAYELAIAKGGSPSVRTLAGMGIAYTWESEKNYANAIQAYDTLVKRLGPKEFMYDEALMAEARAQDSAGKPAAAVEIYERLLREAPDGPHSEEVKTRLASLKSRVRQ